MSEPVPVDDSLPNDVPDPHDLSVAFVGGGSRGYAVNVMRDLALCPDLSGEVRLYDVDHEAAERNARLGNEVVDAHEDARSDWTYRAVPDRAEALSGADFVVLSTQFPIPDAHVKDLEITAEHGIYQPVAVTIGPAGVSWNMRTVPVYRDIAAAVREHCPDAWVFNHSNPMTHLTRTLYREYPGINAVGLCHEVRSAKADLAELVARYYGVDAPDPGEIAATVTGVNHFTWLTDATWRGRDLFAVLDYHLEREGTLREYTTGQLEGDEPVPGDEVDLGNQVAYELYRRFGAFPAAGDRHLVEYAPWFLQGEMPADLHRWGVVRTTVEDRMRYWTERPEQIRRWIAGEETFDLESSGDVMVELMQALLGMGEYRRTVNLPNRGQAADLPEDTVVETEGVFARDRVTPLVAGAMPRGVRAQVLRHVHNQETLVDAAFAGDVDLAFQAFLNDPQTTMQPDRARDLFADLVEAHREHLDGWDLDGATVLADAARGPATR